MDDQEPVISGWVGGTPQVLPTAIRYDTTPLQTVTIGTTAKGQVSIEVKVSDASADAAMATAGRIFRQLREDFAVSNGDHEHYKGKPEYFQET